jgi:hypothetical protein
MSHCDPYLRAAGLILRNMGNAANNANAVDQAAHDLVQVQGELEQTFRQLQKARSRGWRAAAALKRSQLLAKAYSVQRMVEWLLECQSKRPPSPTPQSLPDVYADLRQLEDEFESVELRLKDRIIAVRTDSIELKGVELGPFSIELHITRLKDRSSSCFDCVALEPNPAECNSNVTHPHVSNKALCAGEAAGPISHALRQGRIADAFCLMNAVLHQYNPDSPHVSLHEWGGTHCENCDSLTNPDDMNCCQGCHRDCCSGCSHTCGGCEETFCENCTEEDREVEEHFCSKCRRRCANCNRVVGLKHCDKDTGLCRDCFEDQEDDEPTPDELPEEPYEQTETQTVAAGE